MESFLPVAFGLVGVVALYQTYRRYRQYRTVTSIAADVDPGGRTDGETTVHGPVDVTEPAVPDRERPPEAVETASLPAFVAWRVREQIRTRGKRNGTRWRTIAGGVAGGAFSVLHGGRYVRVDGDALVPDDADEARFDPFDASNLHLGDPETEVRLGEPDPLTRILERLGIIGDDGFLGRVELSINVGRTTLSPDRYQETAVVEGETVAIQGTVSETDGGPVVRGTDGAPPVLVVGDPEERSAQLRRSVGTFLGLAGIMFTLAIATPGLIESLGL